MEMFGAVIAWFQANWSAIESLARNLAADLMTLWALALGLAQVLKLFQPFKGWGERLQSKAMGVLES